MRDIEPVLAAVGCNAGTCHGSAKGKNGFKLSLRGYDPEFDYAALAQDLQGRRINRVQPDKSLMLLKPTGAVPHEGRTLFHNELAAISTDLSLDQEGANFDPQPTTARPNRLEVLPAEAAFDLAGPHATD